MFCDAGAHFSYKPCMNSLCLTCPLAAICKLEAITVFTMLNCATALAVLQISHSLTGRNKAILRGNVSYMFSFADYLAIMKDDWPMSICICHGYCFGPIHQGARLSVSRYPENGVSPANESPKNATDFTADMPKKATTVPISCFQWTTYEDRVFSHRTAHYLVKKACLISFK